MSRKLLLVSGFIISSTLLYAQNLVLNPEFNKRKKNGDAVNWYNYVGGNYFGGYGRYNRFHHLINGRKNVASILVHSGSGNKGFLTGTFKAHLKKGYTYKFRCLISDEVWLDSTNFGVLFLQDAIRFKYPQPVSVAQYVSTNQQDYYSFKFVNSSGSGCSWALAEVEFTAKENYTHFMVGYYGDENLNWDDGVYFDHFSLKAIK